MTTTDKAITKTLKRQRAAVVVEPIHADLDPVMAYVAYISGVKGEPFHAVTIPEGSSAYSMGYRYVSVPDDELAHYLANGAALAAA